MTPNVRTSLRPWIALWMVWMVVVLPVAGCGGDPTVVPEPPTRAFITRLAEGLAEAQQTFGCHLIGGDTDRTPGPFTLTITAIGSLPAGSAVRRTTARPGDVIAVTGTIGDAGLGLALRKDPKRARQAGLSADHAAFLISRFEKPVPRLAAAALVRDFATAAMDVSDGLAKDLARMASASGTGANIQIDKVPLNVFRHQ